MNIHTLNLVQSKNIEFEKLDEYVGMIGPILVWYDLRKYYFYCDF